jgi:hypothetical protein
MAQRPEIRTLSKKTDVEDPPVELFRQRKRPESGQFLLQVDRQTKSSFATSEAAHAAGLAIKTAYPIVQVTVYDSKASVSTLVELPAAATA